MKKLQLAAAGLALLLAAGLTACSSTPANNNTGNTDSTVTDTPAPDTAGTADTAGDTGTQEPNVTVIEQQDSLTVTEETPWLYTRVEVAESGEDGRYRMRVLHDYAAGETIDFVQPDLSRLQYTGEEFYLEPGEQVTYFQRSGESWAAGELSDLKAGSFVYLTCDPSSTVVRAITETAPTGTPQEATTGTTGASDTADTPSDTSDTADTAGASDDSAQP